MANYYGGQGAQYYGGGGGRPFPPQQQSTGEYFSATYMWHQRDRLGQGATGQVFVGYDKKTGNKVAVKMFTRSSEYRAMQNEMQTIKKLKSHPNIVQFLEIDEVEKFSKEHIIVMELCNGGSLYEVIDSPQNAYGLDEYQFKSVISDVAKGLQHLRNHGFVHRDIKPGNIMRCINPNGSYVFKLADFGTARQLQPDEHFTSLHGTEEYLYPAMYERALINLRSQEEFVDKVDLWSVGATFFHLATGRLPFRPYKKREDKGTMYRIITKKESGTILGWQMESNGPITYSKVLPPDTVLPDGLRDKLTPILAGLLDHFENMWEFDRFFSEIESLNAMKVIHVFCVSLCTYQTIYIDPHLADSVPVLKNLISKQTRLNPKHMELFHENILLNADDSPIHSFELPNTKPGSPLTVFGGPPQKPDKLVTPDPVRPPQMPPEVAMVDDLRYAKDATKAIWHIYRSAEKIHRCYELMNQAALCLRESLNKDYHSWCKKFDEVKLLYKVLVEVSNSQISSLQNDIGFLQAINPLCGNVYDSDISELQRELSDRERHRQEDRDELYALENQTADFQTKVHQICQPSSWDLNYCADIFNQSMTTMDTYVKKITAVFEQIQEQKKNRGLMNQYERKAHEYNKRTIKNRLEEGERKLGEMVVGRSQVYARLYTFLENCTPVREDLKSYKESLEMSSASAKERTLKLQKWLSHHKKRMEQLHGKLSFVKGSGLSPPSPPSQPSDDTIATRVQQVIQLLSNNQQSFKGLLVDQSNTLKSYK